MDKLLFFLLCLSVQAYAQDPESAMQSSVTEVGLPLDNRLETDPANRFSEPPLLPEKMMLTQQVFWGPNGLLRLTNVAPLTAEGRQQEQKVRRFMLVSHQVTGYVTLAGFITQVVLNAKLSKATGTTYNQLYNAQQTTRLITNVAYGTTALLSLTAPPKLTTDRAQASRIKLHKYLAIAHLAGFVATNVLANQATHNVDVRPYHQVAALTTIAAFAPALIALRF